ncbi:hypothetical protein Tco_0541265 [Tanacetum coccineum]
MKPLHKTGGDPSRTIGGSKVVPQDNASSSSSQSPVKETIESSHEEELGRGCRKKEASTFLEAIDVDREPATYSQAVEDRKPSKR